MSRESVIFLLGFFIILMPHLGVPADWKMYFYLGAGAACMLCAYSLRRSAYVRSIEQRNGERHTDSFAEHAGSRSGSNETTSMSI